MKSQDKKEKLPRPETVTYQRSQDFFLLETTGTKRNSSMRQIHLTEQLLLHSCKAIYVTTLSPVKRKAQNCLQFLKIYIKKGDVGYFQ